MADDERVALRYAAASHEAVYEPHPIEDAAYAGPHLLAIADGFGNMSSPGSMSEIAVEELRRLDVLSDASELAAKLERGLADLRGRLQELLAHDRWWDGTGTCVTAMLWRDTHAVIAHIGDTRAYMLRGGQLSQLTHDHTLGQLLIDQERIGPGELESDPRYSALSRWLDGKSDKAFEIFAHEAAVGDRYLLCTDSIHDVISFDTLRNILGAVERDPERIVDDIIDAALPAKHYDGFTCIVADVENESEASVRPEPIMAGAVLR